ncbi:unnamed protein product [Amaranthus hypochondriacus]
MLAMALAVSAARRLDTELPVDLTVTKTKVGAVETQGTTKPPMNGCVGVPEAKLEACRNVGPPNEDKVTTPLDGHIPGQTTKN